MRGDPLVWRVFTQVDEMYKQWEERQQFEEAQGENATKTEITWVNKNNLHESKQDMIETFFLKNIRYFTKAWTFYMLVLKRGMRGSFIYIFITKIFTSALTGVLSCCYNYLTIRERGWKLYTDYRRHPHITVKAVYTSSAHLIPSWKGPWEN